MASKTIVLITGGNTGIGEVDLGVTPGETLLIMPNTFQATRW